MLGALNKKFPFNDVFKFNLQSVAAISLGIFLFLLFFLPLNPEYSDFNNKLLILSGFGVITLLLLSLLRIIIPSVFPRLFDTEKWTILKEIILDFIFVSLNTVAYCFYARYVGKIAITFHLTVNIVIISIIPIIIFVVITEFKFLKETLLRILVSNNPAEQLIKPEKYPLIEFKTDSRTNQFTLLPEQIILINAASNYIEIIYKKNEKPSRQLIRTSLKNTEKLLSKYPFLIRCHRSCIVNKNHIQKIIKSPEGLKLVLQDYPHEINISRKYILKVKEALDFSDS